MFVCGGGGGRGGGPAWKLAVVASPCHPGLHDPDLKNQVSPPAAIYNQCQKSLTDLFQATFHVVKRQYK